MMGKLNVVLKDHYHGYVKIKKFVGLIALISVIWIIGNSDKYMAFDDLVYIHLCYINLLLTLLYY